MTHAFADDAQGGEMPLALDANARSGRLRRGSLVRLRLPSWIFFQVAVDVATFAAVGVSFVGVVIGDNRQEIIGWIIGVFVEYQLHLRFSADDQLLAGLATAIGYAAILKVGLLQKGHIYEAHPPEIKAHQKHIAGKVESRCH